MTDPPESYELRPIGLHRVVISSIDGRRLTVRNLEAVDGTPIVDLKPVLDSKTER